VVERFGLQKKLMAITTDNGSNVLKMIRLLGDHTKKNISEWGLFDPQKQHVSCLAHVINLAVQALLGKGGLGAESPEDMESDVNDDDVDDGSGDNAGDAFTSINIGEDPDLINGDLFTDAVVD
ncbi:hypothetical protein FBU30_003023, partial [Linnemannia zychae]